MKAESSVTAITVEVVRSAIVAIAEQMGAIIWRSAHSTVIREMLDFSTAVFDPGGRMIAQASAIPLQLLTLGPPLRKVMRKFPNWAPGDVILTNDPYLADAQHLPDFTMFRPVFSQGRCVAILASMAHQIDCGGRSPGSYGGDATEIYHEGLRIPPVKLKARNRVNRAVEAFLSANSREPEKLLGDVRAQVAALETGESEFHKLLQRHSAETIAACTDQLIAYSERRTRQAIAAVPDGTYTCEQFVDDDGITDQPIPIRVRLIVSGDELTVDFTGTSSQRQGSINATFAMTQATVQYTLMAVLAADIPQNEGGFVPIHIHVPKGSLLDARSPAAVVGRVLPCHRVVDTLLGALAQAVPERVMAGYYGNSNTYSIGGIDPVSGRHWVSFEIAVGGWGGRPGSDGLDAYSAHVHNIQNTPIEMIEASFPLRIERYELLPDSGGRGQWRGGLGLRRDVRLLADQAVVTVLGDRFKFPAPGLFGGESGSLGTWVLLRDGTAVNLPSKATAVPLRKNDVFSARTQGGGGFGDPSRRDRALIERDLREGKIAGPVTP
jgi:N-methylhydantoinase B